MNLIKLKDRFVKGSRGMSIVVGSGLLMATMDMIKTSYIFIEYKDIVTLKDIDKVVLYSLYCDYVFVNAWFSISSPDRLFFMLQYVPENKLYHRMNVKYTRGRAFETLKDAELLNSIKSTKFIPDL